MNLYSGSAFGLMGQVGHCDCIYWECVWFGGTGRSL